MVDHIPDIFPERRGKTNHQTTINLTIYQPQTKTVTQIQIDELQILVICKIQPDDTHLVIISVYRVYIFVQKQTLKLEWWFWRLQSSRSNRYIECINLLINATHATFEWLDMTRL